MSAPASHDVVIVGGGPVGAALGALLARQAAPGDASRILLLERQWPARPVADAPPSLRVSALSRASERVLAAAGAWPAIAAGRRSPYERMHVWPETAAPRGPGSLTFDAAELSEPDLGCIVENPLLQWAALEAFTAAGGSTRSAAVSALHFDASSVRVETSAGEVTARLVVGADGARSAVRALAGLPAEIQDYGQTAVVAVVRPERPHERTAWQRFLGEGTLALLPLPDGDCSIVWSLPQASARHRLECPPEEFSRLVTAASDGVLGELELRGARAGFPLRRLEAPRYALERCVLVGDAAHMVHPLAGQGVNLGFLDAAALAQVLAGARDEREDPGALRVLRRYERWRKGDNQLVGTAIDGFNRFLSFGRDRAGRFAQRGLGWVEGSAIAKRLLIERAMGLAGDMPAVARRRSG
jgi:2-octaprenylphenol hydroxylase